MVACLQGFLSLERLHLARTASRPVVDQALRAAAQPACALIRRSRQRARGSSRCRPPRASRPRRADPARAPCLHARPCRPRGSPRAAAAQTPARARPCGSPAPTGRPCRRPASVRRWRRRVAPRGARARRERHRPQRVDQRHRVRPALLRGARARRHIGGVRGQLHDQRLARARAHRPHDHLQLTRVGADVEARLHVRTATRSARSRRSPRARRTPARAQRSPPRSEPITFVISGTGSRASAGRSSAR